MDLSRLEVEQARLLEEVQTGLPKSLFPQLLIGELQEKSRHLLLLRAGQQLRRAVEKGGILRIFGESGEPEILDLAEAVFRDELTDLFDSSHTEGRLYSTNQATRERSGESWR